MTKFLAVLLGIIQFFSVFLSGQFFLPVKDNGETAVMETQERCEERAKILAHSLYRNYYVKPFNVLVMNDDFTGVATNWEYGALLSLSVSMAQIDESYIDECEKVVDGLKYYRHLGDKLEFKGYAVKRSEIPYAADEGVAYDDNMWVCRDLVALYELTNNKKYLNLATEITDFLISDAYIDLDPSFLREAGYDVPDNIGGFYWDNRHEALHTCSNGPAIQSLAALYRITGNETYLVHAQNAYNFVKTLITPDGVFYDLMRFVKDENNVPVGVLNIDKATYTYNSGSPITGAVELYKVTNDESYLDDAKYWAESAYNYYAKDTDAGIKEYPSRAWFALVLLNGFCALKPYDDSCKTYINSFLEGIDYAYDNYRSEDYFHFGGTALPHSWAYGFGKENDDTSVQNVASNAEIYARLAVYAD